MKPINFLVSVHVYEMPDVNLDTYNHEELTGCMLRLGPELTIHLPSVSVAISLGATIERAARELAGRLEQENAASVQHQDSSAWPQQNMAQDPPDGPLLLLPPG